MDNREGENHKDDRDFVGVNRFTATEICPFILLVTVPIETATYGAKMAKNFTNIKYDDLGENRHF